MPQDSSGVRLASEFVDQIRSNIKSDLIEITEDKLENILLKHLKKMAITQSWITPASLFLTILLIFLTANFKDFAGLDKSVWTALFVLLLIGTFFWSIYSIYQAITNTKKTSIDYLIREIKNKRDESRMASTL